MHRQRPPSLGSCLKMGWGSGVIQANTCYPSAGSNAGCWPLRRAHSKVTCFSFLRAVFPASPLPITSLSRKVLVHFHLGGAVLALSLGKKSGSKEEAALEVRATPRLLQPRPSACIQFGSKDIPGGLVVKTTHFQSSNSGDTSWIPGQGTDPLDMWHRKKEKNLASEERVSPALRPMHPQLCPKERVTLFLSSFLLCASKT